VAGWGGGSSRWHMPMKHCKSPQPDSEEQARQLESRARKLESRPLSNLQRREAYDRENKQRVD